MPSLWAAPHPSHSLWCGEPVGGCSFLRPLVPCWTGWSKLAALHPVGFPVWPFCLALPPSKRRPRDPSGSGASTVQYKYSVCVCVCVCMFEQPSTVGYAVWGAVSKSHLLVEFILHPPLPAYKHTGRLHDSIEYWES